MSADTGMAVPETKRRIVRWWGRGNDVGAGRHGRVDVLLALAPLETERNDYDLSREDASRGLLQRNDGLWSRRPAATSGNARKWPG